MSVYLPGQTAAMRRAIYSLDISRTDCWHVVNAGARPIEPILLDLRHDRLLARTRSALWLSGPSATRKSGHMHRIGEIYCLIRPHSWYIGCVAISYPSYLIASTALDMKYFGNSKDA
jgi:hypothetical protein